MSQSTAAGDAMPVTMRAVVVTRPGGLDALAITDVPVPVRQPGWVRIKMKAFGVNESEVTDQAALYANDNPAIGSVVANQLYGRQTPSTSLEQVNVFEYGTQLRIWCQISDGEAVVGPDGTVTTVWDFVGYKNGQQQWVSDAWVYTGSWDMVAPPCYGAAVNR